MLRENEIMEENKSRKWRSYLRSLGPLLLSHHPICDEFNSHFIKVGKIKLCVGCFIGYPTVIIGIILLGAFKLPALLGSELVLMIAFILMSTFILTPLNLTRLLSVKILQKILIGLGSCFLFYYIWMLPNPFLINFVLFLISFGALSALLNLYHFLGIHSTCKKCSFAGEWENCPGFKEINIRLDKNGLDHVFNLSLKKKKLDTEWVKYSFNRLISWFYLSSAIKFSI